MSYFLIQVNGAQGYPYVIANHRYDNDMWVKKRRDRAHGEVELGDTLLFYCTGDVTDCPKTLAFSTLVKKVSPDHVEFELDEPRRFLQPLPRDQIAGPNH